jgi:hypothetical protein
MRTLKTMPRNLRKLYVHEFGFRIPYRVSGGGGGRLVYRSVLDNAIFVFATDELGNRSSKLVLFDIR